MRPGELDAVMVRRLKSDLRYFGEKFPERVVEPIAIGGLPNDAPELLLSCKLAEYGEVIRARAANLSPREAGYVRLTFVGLQQRLLSSIAAFAKTLEVHRKISKGRDFGAWLGLVSRRGLATLEQEAKQTRRPSLDGPLRVARQHMRRPGRRNGLRTKELHKDKERSTVAQPPRVRRCGEPDGGRHGVHRRRGVAARPVARTLCRRPRQFPARCWGAA